MVREGLTAKQTADQGLYRAGEPRGRDDSQATGPDYERDRRAKRSKLVAPEHFDRLDAGRHRVVE
jgi:hypothetical protein